MKCCVECNTTIICSFQRGKCNNECKLFTLIYQKNAQSGLLPLVFVVCLQNVHFIFIIGKFSTTLTRVITSIFRPQR